MTDLISRDDVIQYHIGRINHANALKENPAYQTIKPALFDEIKFHEASIREIMKIGANEAPDPEAKTLRDYFAGQWVAAGIRGNLSARAASVMAYQYADAMMEARKQ